MPFPPPAQGLVIRYSYLWRTEHLRGREEGVKDRPCSLILVTSDGPAGQIVTVLPITHSPPSDPAFAVEISTATKERLRLDAERSWVVLTEAYRFLWPGPDLRPRSATDPESVAYGMLPAALIEHIRIKFVALLKGRRAKLVVRTE